jgi:RNA-binding protein NOB1
MAVPDPILVVDSNFFIEDSSAVQCPLTVYTTADALLEVRNTRARTRLSQFQASHQVITRVPSSESISRVSSAAKDGGNLSLLSLTDVRLLALALDFMPADAAAAAPAPPPFREDEWITPATFGRLEDFPVVLCTSDTTMQCVALVLGLHVISPGGRRISQVKRWLLRCGTCGAETFDAEREFCPECGQHELVRYALVMRDGVERELPLPARFKPSPRGKRYPIPTNRGGKGRPPELILSEDMMAEARRKWRWTGGKRAKDAAAGDGHLFFEPRRKARAEPVYGCGKVNPNVPRRAAHKKK